MAWVGFGYRDDAARILKHTMDYITTNVVGAYDLQQAIAFSNNVRISASGQRTEDHGINVCPGGRSRRAHLLSLKQYTLLMRIRIPRFKRNS